MVIETERLILREYTLDDFNALFEIVSAPETMQRFSFIGKYHKEKSEFTDLTNSYFLNDNKLKKTG